MEKEYESFESFTHEIESEGYKVESGSLISLNYQFRKFSLKEKIQAFLLIHQSIDKTEKENLHAFSDLMRDAFKDRQDIITTGVRMLEEGNRLTQRRLEKLEELMKLSTQRSVFPFQKGKTYSVVDWEYSFHAHTGEQTDNIHSSKARVLENSHLINTYDTFILEPSLLYHDDTHIPYILVQASYGKYKECSVYLRSDKLTLNTK
jgi:hypothetical protein